MNGSLLAVDGLHVRRSGGVDALRGVTFCLEPGETLAIVGESGAGKSTLAHCLLGMIQPPEARGSVRLVGHELLGASAQLLRSLRWSTVAIVPQSSALHPVARVGVQITEPLSAPKRTLTGARAEQLAQEVGLEVDLLARYPHELSGGQLRRVMLAMALVLDPALVILDEPTVGLDPAGRHALLERIVELSRSRGFGLLVATHDLPAAVRLTERRLMLYAGEVIESADTTALAGSPAHPYSRARVGVSGDEHDQGPATHQRPRTGSAGGAERLRLPPPHRPNSSAPRADRCWRSPKGVWSRATSAGSRRCTRRPR